MSNKKAMQRMCMAFDIYFNEDVFDSCDTKDDAVVGKYFRKMNLGQYRDKKFDDSLDEGLFELSGDRKKVKGKRVAIVDEYDNVQEETESSKISPKDIEKWGIGFDIVDYGILNSHYKFLKKVNPNCDNNQEIFINDLCYTKMQQLKAVREGRVDDYSKLTESYRKTFQQAGLKTVQDENKTSDDCWSQWTGIISQYTPEEYYKDKQLYADWDDLGEYYQRMAVRPLKNLQLGTNERDKEYYVHDDKEL